MSVSFIEERAYRVGTMFIARRIKYLNESLSLPGRVKTEEGRTICLNELDALEWMLLQLKQLEREHYMSLNAKASLTNGQNGTR